MKMEAQQLLVRTLPLIIAATLSGGFTGNAMAENSTEKDSYLDVGGAIRFNYGWLDYGSTDGIDLELLRADLKAGTGPVSFSAQYRWYDGFDAIHHAWLGWQFTPDTALKAGITAAPSSIWAGSVVMNTALPAATGATPSTSPPPTPCPTASETVSMPASNTAAATPAASGCWELPALSAGCRTSTAASTIASTLPPSTRSGSTGHGPPSCNGPATAMTCPASASPCLPSRHRSRWPPMPMCPPPTWPTTSARSAGWNN